MDLRPWANRIWIVGLLALCLLPGNPLRAQDMPGVQVILPAGKGGDQQALADSGAYLISDYGTFSLWMAPPSDASLTRMSDTLSIHPEFNQLWLREGVLDTRTPPPDEPGRAETGFQLHLVQFVGPVRDEWLADLQDTGARIVAYVPYNGYVVWADEAARADIEQRVASRTEYQWHGPYRAAYRLEHSLSALALRTDAPSGPADIVIQIVDHAGSKQTTTQILNRSQAILREPYGLLGTIVLTVRLPASSLYELAERADVLNIEPYHEPQLLDERQGQIMAGNLNPDATQPSGPGYLAWLAGRGFPTDPTAYPIVAVIDDGFDNGNAEMPAHPDFYRLGIAGNGSRMAFAWDLTTDGEAHSAGGHGTLNLSIAGGYNDRAGALYEDSAGYQYGLGISPYGRLASIKVFNDQGLWNARVPLTEIIKGAYQGGARITNDSWGAATNAYNVDAQAFDALTRDADANASGNQQMTHVIAAGNNGSSEGTVSAPSTAKNVITVGASENYRQTGVDGCGFGNGIANNVQDIAGFSGRGPTADGRAKPDIIAPGTHIQGAASQDPEYHAGGVCDPYWPTGGQTLYTWSTGTSHAAPAIAGGLSLLDAYWQAHYGASLSPAMRKAYLLNSARYVNGVYGGGSLPSNAQGWGRAGLGMAFDGIPRLWVDQSVLLGSTGQAYERRGLVADPSQPFRVTLVWTDAPGTPSAAAWVNDLNLEVTVGGQTYRGNVFYLSSSVPGGSADGKNNVESVFLPAGTSGSLVVRVVAANIAGNGVPGNGDSTDQDFALVIYNAVEEQHFTLSAQPTDAQVCRGSTVTFTLSVDTPAGYTRAVVLTHSAPPADVEIAISPDQGVSSFKAAMPVTTHLSTQVGLYPIAVTGTGAVLRTTTVTLAIDAAAPAAPALLSPPDGLAAAAPRPVFTWEGVPGARGYEIQIAIDDAFAKLTIDQAISSTTYVPHRELRTDSTYYWRVIAQNGCGSDVSATRVLTTANLGAQFYDSVEDGPDQWLLSTVRGTARWQIRTARSHSPSRAWHIVDAPEATDAQLITAVPIALYETSSLSFWHWFDMEATGTTDVTAWDGGVIEISIDGGTWQDLGPRIVQGGYNHSIPPGPSNPLAGRMAWGGYSGGWQQVMADLSPFAGRSARLRFRWGGDQNNAGTFEGWYVDDVQVTSTWPPSKYRAYLSPVYNR